MPTEHLTHTIKKASEMYVVGGAATVEQTGELVFWYAIRKFPVLTTQQKRDLGVKTKTEYIQKERPPFEQEEEYREFYKKLPEVFEEGTPQSIMRTSPQQLGPSVVIVEPEPLLDYPVKPTGDNSKDVQIVGNIIRRIRQLIWDYPVGGGKFTSTEGLQGEQLRNYINEGLMKRAQSVGLNIIPETVQYISVATGNIYSSEHEVRQDIERAINEPMQMAAGLRRSTMFNTKFIRELVRIGDMCDRAGLHQEADEVRSILESLKKKAQEEDPADWWKPKEERENPTLKPEMEPEESYPVNLNNVEEKLTEYLHDYYWPHLRTAMDDFIKRGEEPFKSWEDAQLDDFAFLNMFIEAGPWTVSPRVYGEWAVDQANEEGTDVPLIAAWKKVEQEHQDAIARIDEAIREYAGKVEVKQSPLSEEEFERGMKGTAGPLADYLNYIQSGEYDKARELFEQMSPELKELALEEAQKAFAKFDVKKLLKTADALDKAGFTKLADEIDEILKEVEKRKEETGSPCPATGPAHDGRGKGKGLCEKRRGLSDDKEEGGGKRYRAPVAMVKALLKIADQMDSEGDSDTGDLVDSILEELRGFGEQEVTE